jgi:hypothetical protein
LLPARASNFAAKGFPSMTVSESDLRSSLIKHANWLKNFHDDLIRGFVADGLVHGSGADTSLGGAVTAAAAGRHKLSPLQAKAASQANANLNRLFAQTERRCSRYGISLSGDQPIPLAEIDAKLTASRVSTNDRLALKSALRNLLIL